MPFILEVGSVRSDARLLILRRGGRLLGYHGGVAVVLAIGFLLVAYVQVNGEVAVGCGKLCIACGRAGVFFNGKLAFFFEVFVKQGRWRSSGAGRPHVKHAACLFSCVFRGARRPLRCGIVRAHGCFHGVEEGFRVFCSLCVIAVPVRDFVYRRSGVGHGFGVGACKQLGFHGAHPGIDVNVFEHACGIAEIGHERFDFRNGVIQCGLIFFGELFVVLFRPERAGKPLKHVFRVGTNLLRLFAYHLLNDIV